MPKPLPRAECGSVLHFVRRDDDTEANIQRRLRMTSKYQMCFAWMQRRYKTRVHPVVEQKNQGILWTVELQRGRSGGCRGHNPKAMHTDDPRTLD